MSAKRFQRAKSHSHKVSTDVRGTVVVKCFLYKGPTVLKGNRVTSLRVADAKVTEVHAAIERALFN